MYFFFFGGGAKYSGVSGWLFDDASEPEFVEEEWQGAGDRW